EAQTSVDVFEPGLCPRYAARLIRGVKIGPSPQWLARRVESVGMRSINNVVDVTNFIMMELGPPLHAFDFNLLRGRRIVVKRAGEGEVFTTLDGQQRQLAAGDLTICDGEGPVALAGIMGGENTEIRPDTADILLESAYFNPPTIRRTSKRLGVHTESSHRFERGADVDMVPVALDRATSLIVEVAGGIAARGAIDVYPQPLPGRKLTVTSRRVSEILGIELDLLEIQRLLRSIGLGAEQAEDREDGALYVTVPAFRPDLEREIDLIEEIARLNGYDRIPVTMPLGRVICHRRADHQKKVIHVRNAMVASGFSEIINYSFISPEVWDRIGLSGEDSRRRNVAILNPLTEEQSVMRTSLVPSLLETVARNLSYRTRDLRLFELRSVFLPRTGEELPEEKLRLSGVACGRREPEGWSQGGELVDFFDLKGVAEGLLERFQVGKTTWVADAGEAFLHPGKSCCVYRDDCLIGTLGEVHPRVCQAYDIDLPLFLLDFDLEALFLLAGPVQGFRPLSRFPDVSRDSAFLVDEEISAGQILETLDQARGKDVEDIVLFDLYRGKGVPEGKKSLAIRVRYRSPERTLTDDEINRIHGRFVDALRKQVGAEIR
ncbi:MAG: phenylalanine--tRNA ligase subunit beta, partial [Desulfuromonadales bacterium]